MTDFQKVVKYIAIAFAIALTVAIVGGIFNAIGLLGGLFSEDNEATDDIKTYSITSDINKLKIEINAADLYIKKGDEFSVESNLKKLKVKEKNGTLTLEEKSKNFGSYNGAKLTIFIPTETEFDNVKLITGAGRLTIEKLSAKKLDFVLGAGEVIIENLIAANEADVDGGAGKITISDGVLHNLDLDMGVGQLNLTSVLTGESEFDLGIGESNITVIGNKDDYRLDIEKGIGNITVDGTVVSNIKGQGKGKNTIEISGGIGAINLKYQDAEAR